MQGRSAGHSGLTNGYVSQDVQGQVPGTEIFYSIQGNILRAGLRGAERGAGLHQDHRHDHRSRDGGDGSGRWIRRRQPLQLPALADRRHGAGDRLRRPHLDVAYILAADPKDTNGDSHNNGKYSMYLTTSQPGPDKGPYQIKAGENLNPVKTLRMRYDAWKKTQHAANNGLPNPLPPPTPPQGGGGGGQNRRGPIQVLSLTTTAWADGGTIPAKYTQAGAQVSPPLAWSNVPDGVQSFVLIARDADAAIGNGTDDILHWMLWNIPASARSLAEGDAAGQSVTGRHAADQRERPVLSRTRRAGLRARRIITCSSSTRSMRTIDVPAVGQSPPLTRAAVEQAMAGKIRAQGIAGRIVQALINATGSASSRPPSVRRRHHILVTLTVREPVRRPTDTSNPGFELQRT